MLDQANHEAGGRCHHSSLCGTCIGDLIATGIHKAFRLQEFICLIKIVLRKRHSNLLSDFCLSDPLLNKSCLQVKFYIVP